MSLSNHLSRFVMIGLIGAGGTLSPGRAGSEHAAVELSSASSNETFHVQYRFEKTDRRSEATRTELINRLVRQEEVNLKARGFAADAIQKNVAFFKAGLDPGFAPVRLQCELWVKGTKWLLKTVDPTVKKDVFSGDDPGSTVWLFDGERIFCFSKSGFMCRILKASLAAHDQVPDIAFLPELPFVGFSYASTPLSAPVSNLKAPLPHFQKPQGSNWTTALFPSHIDLSGVGAYLGAPHLMYDLGFARTGSWDGKNVLQEICIYSPSRPFEKWTFGNYQANGGDAVPMRTLIESFSYSQSTGYRPDVIDQREFSIAHFDRTSLDDAQFDPHLYLKPGAVIEARRAAVNDFDIFDYQSGNPWDHRPAPGQSSQASAEPHTSMLVITSMAGLLALAVIVVAVVRRARPPGLDSSGEDAQHS